MTDDQIQALAIRAPLKVHVQRLDQNHPQPGKIYVAFTDATGAGVTELFLTDYEYGQALQKAAALALAPA